MNTKTVEQSIITILKSYVNNIGVTIPNDIELNLFYHLVEINSISGIVWYELDRSENSHIQEIIKKRFCNDFYSTISLATIRDENMKMLISQMDKKKIDHVLFKGYVLKNLYPVPELRTYGDIDFAIRLEDREKCDLTMKQNGFKLLDNWEPVFSYEKDMEHYEIHTELIDSNLNEKVDYRGYFKDFWSHTYIISGHSYVLDPEFHLIYLLLHIAKHIYGSGAGIRMYLDIAFYLREYRNQINWEHFKQEINTIRLSKFVNTVFNAVEEWFGIKSPIPLVEVGLDFMDEFLTFTLNGGVFGYYSKAAKLSQVRKNSQGKSVKRADTLLKRAFPSAKTIKSRYTYLDGKPWLLPVAWAHRFFIKKGSTARYLKEGKEILKTNKNDIMELNDFYCNIGL